MKTLELSFLDNEVWYGIGAGVGSKMPLDCLSDFDYDVHKTTENEENHVFLSSRGRYVYGEGGFSVSVHKGKLSFLGGKLHYSEEDSTLKGAYLDACRRFFPPNGKLPPKEFFVLPQYNTWIELTYNQNEKDILEYADKVIENDLPRGILMIDDKWSAEYGTWSFDEKKFGRPMQMIERLHGLGFKVMLWVCPFAREGSEFYQKGVEKDCLIKNKRGENAKIKWWNGEDYCLDLSNEDACELFEGSLNRLMAEYSVDGFKFDAGDIRFYDGDFVTKKNDSPFTACERYSRIANKYAYNEIRASVNMAGTQLVSRLCDKDHAWDTGVAAVVPDMLLQGLTGYLYGCPDMIGGGQYLCFLDGAKIDEELFVRYAEASALMPMMQYSAAPWRALNRENAKLCLKQAALHGRYADYVYSLAEHAAKTGEPIVRYMEYVYPNSGYQKITDQFMLGDSILVAPVVKKGETQRRVVLPRGKWKYVDGKVYEGEQKITVSAEVGVLPFFTAIN